MRAVTLESPPVVRIIGLPGAFTEWGTRLLTRLCRAAGFRPVQRGLQNAPAAARESREPEALLLVGHGPAFASEAFAAASAAHTVVFLEEPAAALHRLMQSGQHPRDAARTLTATLAPLEPILADARTLVVPQLGDLTAARVGDAIASHLGLALDLSTNGAEEPPELDGHDLQLPDPAAAMIHEVLLPLARHVLRGEREEITWPVGCFYDADRPGEPAPDLADLVGPARVVYYGPYFHMPSGRWQVTAELWFSDANSTFLIDVFTTEALTKVRLRPPAAGAFRAEFPVSIERPEDRIEVRLWLERGALEGRAGLRRVTWRPLP